MELSNKRHETFCQEYAKDYNGAAAAVRAGYSERCAAAQASRLLRNVNICTRVEQIAAAIASERIADAEEVLAYLTAVMRGEVDISRGQIRAAEILAKHHGLLVPAPTEKICSLL